MKKVITKSTYVVYEFVQRIAVIVSNFGQLMKGIGISGYHVAQ